MHLKDFSGYFWSRNCGKLTRVYVGNCKNFQHEARERVVGNLVNSLSHTFLARRTLRSSDRKSDDVTMLPLRGQPTDIYCRISQSIICLSICLSIYLSIYLSICLSIYIQQDATLHILFISRNCSTCFRWYLHPSSGAQTTVSTASVICQTVTFTCRYRLCNTASCWIYSGIYLRCTKP